MPNILKTLIVFPKVSDKPQDYKRIIDLKVSNFFKEEDQEWAKKFIYNISKKENFKELKKQIGALALIDFIKYHTYFEEIIDDENNIELIDDSLEKIIKFNQLCCRAVDLSSFKHDLELFEENCSLIEEDLSKGEESQILQKLLYDIESTLNFNEKQQSLHKIMILNTKKELYDRIHQIKNTVRGKYHKNNEREIMSYIQTASYKNEKRKNLKMF